MQPSDHSGSDEAENDPAADSANTARQPDDAETTSTDGRGESTLDATRRSIRRFVDVLRGSTVDVTEYEPTVHGPLIEFDVPDGLEEVDRYWVDAPFSFVSIGYDHEENEHRYHAVEPTLREDERVLLETLLEDVRDPLLYREEDGEDVEELLWETIRDSLERYGAEIDAATFSRLFYYIFRDFRGYGRLDPIMHDPHVEDVSCDGYDLPIFVYHDEYTDIETTVSFGETALDQFVVRLAQHSGRHISIGDPMVETTLPDGSRAELALGEEVTPRGSAFTIRKYADDPLTPIGLLEYGTFSVEQLAYLWLAIEHNRSLLFAGGTASGKTTSMNAISMFIPPRSKVVTIEDTHELQLSHDNWLSSVTRERIHEGTNVTMYDLLRSALRHRPEYIVVGEVRGEEAMTLFQAMNTGHTTYSTDLLHDARRFGADGHQPPRERTDQRSPVDGSEPRYPLRPDAHPVGRQACASKQGPRRDRRGRPTDGRTRLLDRLHLAKRHRQFPEQFEPGSLRNPRRTWLSQTELLTELEHRERFLEYLRSNGIADYQRFTALVNQYYSDRERILETIGDESDGGTGVDGETGANDGTDGADGIDTTDGNGGDDGDDGDDPHHHVAVDPPAAGTGGDGATRTDSSPADETPGDR